MAFFSGNGNSTDVPPSGVGWYLCEDDIDRDHKSEVAWYLCDDCERDKVERQERRRPMLRGISIQPLRYRRDATLSNLFLQYPKHVSNLNSISC